jgi:peptidoglycan/xylan/chitin deacetylase (PgdA/CDA1 family)
MGQVILTFDTEDFASENSIRFLHSLLSCLEKHKLKALFFVTGHMAERLKAYPEITNLLEEHEIGYHSSGHSVHPTIFEFTDVKSYKEAYKVALARETSHINPLTGQIEGKGGISAVRLLSHNKEIVAYRAPGFCWSPPHSEALRDLGLRFDFSTIIASLPVSYKGLTFYPYPALREWHGRLSDYRMVLSSAFRRRVTVVAIHPSLFVSQNPWDSIYHEGNPKRITSPPPRAISEREKMFRSFDLFLRRAKQLERMGLVQLTPRLRRSERELVIAQDRVEIVYERSMKWPREFFRYEPRHLRKHFYEFFKVPTPAESAKT